MKKKYINYIAYNLSNLVGPVSSHDIRDFMRKMGVNSLSTASEDRLKNTAEKLYLMYVMRLYACQSAWLFSDNSISEMKEFIGAEEKLRVKFNIPTPAVPCGVSNSDIKNAITSVKANDIATISSVIDSPAKSVKKTAKTVKKKMRCKKDEIRNPSTGRCVKRSGKIGKSLLKKASKKSSKSSTSSKTCKAKKKSGDKCANKAKPGSRYCGIHRNYK